MKRKIGVLIVGAALVAGLLPATAFAAQTEPGTPGDPNCHGQTIAFLAQAFGVQGVHGIGNLAKATGLSVQEIQAIVDQFCNP